MNIVKIFAFSRKMKPSLDRRHAACYDAMLKEDPFITFDSALFLSMKGEPYAGY
jgi:hypothetical protein